MTPQEFSNEFDILYNNISSNASPGLNEYEKSVVLTKAEIEYCRNLFNPKGNKYQEGFDGSPKRQIDFHKLISVVNPTKITTDLSTYTKFDKRGVLYQMPQNIMYIINETATITYDSDHTHDINIVPITFDELQIFKSRPYKQPYKYHGWRLLDTNKNNGNTISEIIVKTGATISDYTVRYIRFPKPIILFDLSTVTDYTETFGGLTILGETAQQTCALDESVHPEILQRAVEIAKSTAIGDINSLLTLGGRSE